MLTELVVALLISTASAESGPPTFELRHEDFRLEQGYKAEVWCEASGDKPMKYSWYDQFSNEISSDQTQAVHCISSTTGSALVFDVFLRQYEGLYTCSAQNARGKESKEYNITAHPLKNETVKLLSVNVKNITDTSVIFSPVVRGNPSGYIVKYIEALEKKEITLETPASADIEISGLIPSGSYEFQFKIQSSSSSTNEEWTKIEVVLLPDAPEVIPRSLGSGTLKIEWFRTFNDTMRKTIDGYMVSYRSVQQMRGNYWVYGNCFTNVTIPACAVSAYTITGLEGNFYQDIHVAAHTKTGYGKSTNFKIRIQ